MPGPRHRSPALRRSLLALICLTGLGACANPQTSSPGGGPAVTVFEGEKIYFYLADGTPVPGVPEPCGEAIPVTQVKTLDVSGDTQARATIETTFPSARFVRDGYVLANVVDSVDRTRPRLERYFASLGCDALVFGDTERVFTRSDLGPGSTLARLRLMWGVSDDGKGLDGAHGDIVPDRRDFAVNLSR